MNNIEVEFIRDLLIFTWEDPTQTTWEKFKFTVWLFQATTPQTPFIL